MYTIFCDGHLLHSELQDYQLRNVKLVMEVNNPGSLEFAIDPGHPNYWTLSKIKPEIKVYKAGQTKPYWKGRIREDYTSIDGVRKIYAEGKLKALEDTVLRPRIFDGTAAEVFADYLDSHNAQVSDVQKIFPGTIDIVGDVYRDLKNYETTYSRIQDLVSSFDGYLFLRHEADGDYLDWVDDFETVSSQTIELGTNILDLSDEIETDTLYTACIPLGAKLVDENGATTETRLGVESVNGVDYVYDSDAAELYGRIYAPTTETTWDDVTSATTLMSRASAYLAAHKGMVNTLTISAIDLAYVSEVDSFNFCEYIQVNSDYHNISDQFLLSRVEIDITNPENTKIILGGSVRTLTEKNKQDRDAAVFAVNELITALTGTAQGLAGEIAAREAYIRYDGGVIEMGETGSSMRMRLSNTKLSFWETLGGVETEVAYIANPSGNPGDSKLYIENAEILSSLLFGGFAFEVRDNGNVSFVWKG